MSQAADEPLRREIGFFGSAFLAFNGVVGGGIFALPATLYTQFGAFSPFLFPLFGLLALVIAIPFARVASRHAVSGGPVVYGAAFGPAVSFQAGWLYYTARGTALAANATLLVTYLATWFPGLAEGLPRGLVLVALCGLITLINVVGVKRAVRFLDLLTFLKATPLLLMALVGLAMAGTKPPGPPPKLDALEAAALLILFAFVGFENSVVAAGETADAKRTVPRALVTTVAATAILYFLVQLAYVAVMAPGASKTPMADFGAALIGPAGRVLLTATAIFSLLGNISGGMTGTTRTTYAMGRDGLLPGWFARVSPRYATPANSILFMGALIALLALSGSFVWLAVVSTLARMFVYAISIASLAKGERPPAWLWAMMVAAIAVCAWAAAQSKWESWRMLLILGAAGTLLYVLARLTRRTGPDAGAAGSADTGLEL